MRHKIQKVYWQREIGHETTGTNYRFVVGYVRARVIGESPREREWALAKRWSAAIILAAVAFYLLVLTDIGPIQ